MWSPYHLGADMPGLHYPEFFRFLDPGTGSAGRPSHRPLGCYLGKCYGCYGFSPIIGSDGILVGF